MVDQARDFFGKHADAYAKSMDHRSGEDLMKLVEYLAPRKSELAADIGTGTGFTAAALSRSVKTVYAIDPTPEMLSRARDLCREEGAGNVEFIEAEASSTGLGDSSMGIVATRRAAHHFPDKGSFLRESHRILASGGRIGISDMVAPEDDARDVFNALERIRDGSHAGAMKKSEWISLLSDTGFEVTHVWDRIKQLKFEEWLSPVAANSDEGRGCKSYLDSLNPRQRGILEYDPVSASFVKRWVVIVAKRT